MPMNRPVSTTPDSLTDRLIQAGGIGDHAELAVEDPVAAVGAEKLAGRIAPRLRLGAEPAQAVGCGLPAERHDLDRHRRGSAKPLNQLPAIGDDDQPIARRRDDLFAQQGAAETLDQVERADLDLVGAVDRDVDPPVFGEAGERDAAARAWAALRSEVGMPTDAQAVANPADQRLDGKLGGRAGAETDDHAVLDQGRRSFGRGPLLGVAVHQARAPRGARAASCRSRFSLPPPRSCREHATRRQFRRGARSPASRPWPRQPADRCRCRRGQSPPHRSAGTDGG